MTPAADKLAAGWWSSLMPLAGIGALAYMLPHLFKEKKMTALENSMLNFIVPLIDKLRQVEKERDTEKERYGKLSDEKFKLERENNKLSDQIDQLRGQAAVAASEIRCLKETVFTLEQKFPKDRKPKAPKVSV